MWLKFDLILNFFHNYSMCDHSNDIVINCYNNKINKNTTTNK